MRHAIAAALVLGTALLPAVAQEQPPTEQMDKAVPEMKSDTKEQQPPTKSVGEAVPEMKSTNKGQSAETGTQTPGGVPFTLTEDDVKNWIGGDVYSRDGKKVGDIADLKRDPDNKVTDLYVDIGGFFGIGSTRALISSDQIQEVKTDSLVLTLSEAEAKTLPAADKK